MAVPSVQSGSGKGWSQRLSSIWLLLMDVLKWLCRFFVLCYICLI